MSKKLSLKGIKEQLQIINPNIEILSDEYINRKTKLKCKCLIDGYEWEATWNGLFSKKRGCPVCGGSMRLTIEMAKSNILKISPNIEILSDVYTNAGTELKCKCKIDECIWTATYRNLHNGKGCPKCGGSEVLSLEIIKYRLPSINPNIEIISSNYTNVSTLLVCKCKLDGEIFNTTWNRIQSGHGCPQCFIESETGENCHLWKGGITPLAFYLRYQIQQWRVDSFVKYNSRCDITGSNKECQIHHFHNFSNIVIETLQKLNLPIYKQINEYTKEELKSIEDACNKLHYDYGLGICLCKEEHKLFHSAYGIKNNTEEQYILFKENRLLLRL